MSDIQDRIRRKEQQAQREQERAIEREHQKELNRQAEIRAELSQSAYERTKMVEKLQPIADEIWDVQLDFYTNSGVNGFLASPPFSCSAAPRIDEEEARLILTFARTNKDVSPTQEIRNVVTTTPDSQDKFYLAIELYEKGYTEDMGKGSYQKIPGGWKDCSTINSPSLELSKAQLMEELKDRFADAAIYHKGRTGWRITKLVAGGCLYAFLMFKCAGMVMTDSEPETSSHAESNKPMLLVNDLTQS